VTQEDPWLQAFPDVHIFWLQDLRLYLSLSRMSFQRVVSNIVSRFSILFLSPSASRLLFTSWSLVSVSWHRNPVHAEYSRNLK